MYVYVCVARALDHVPYLLTYRNYQLPISVTRPFFPNILTYACNPTETSADDDVYLYLPIRPFPYTYLRRMQPHQTPNDDDDDVRRTQTNPSLTTTNTFNRSNGVGDTMYLKRPRH